MKLWIVFRVIHALEWLADKLREKFVLYYFRDIYRKQQ